MRICAHIYVLDFGRMIFEGTPSEIGQSEVVQAAYLGSEEAMEAAGVSVSEEEVARA